jgi:hypothetical protein
VESEGIEEWVARNTEGSAKNRTSCGLILGLSRRIPAAMTRAAGFRRQLQTAQSSAVSLSEGDEIFTSVCGCGLEKLRARKLLVLLQRVFQASVWKMLWAIIGRQRPSEHMPGSGQ